MVYPIDANSENNINVQNIQTAVPYTFDPKLELTPYQSVQTNWKGYNIGAYGNFGWDENISPLQNKSL